MISTTKLRTKFKFIAVVQNRFAHKISVDAMRALRDAKRVFRIMVSLHSAKDLPSVLRLYCAEDLSVIN